MTGGPSQSFNQVTVNIGNTRDSKTIIQSRIFIPRKKLVPLSEYRTGNSVAFYFVSFAYYIFAMLRCYNPSCCARKRDGFSPKGLNQHIRRNPSCERHFLAWQQRQNRSVGEPVLVLGPGKDPESNSLVYHDRTNTCDSAYLSSNGNGEDENTENLDDHSSDTELATVSSNFGSRILSQHHAITGDPKNSSFQVTREKLVSQPQIFFSLVPISSWFKDDEWTDRRPPHNGS